jgi:quercetin dioxygenase-like cupin family protein
MRRTIYNPLFKDSCTFLKTSKETDGAYSELELELDVNGENPLHTHSTFNETFTAIEGNLGLTVGNKDIILRPGQSLTVKKGEPHRFFNPGDEVIRYAIVFQPGHTGMENMLRILYGLAEDGQSNNKGIPKSLTTIAVLQEMSDTKLRGILSLLTPVLKLLAFYGRRKSLKQTLLHRYCSEPLERKTIL